MKKQFEDNVRLLATWIQAKASVPDLDAPLLEELLYLTDQLQGQISLYFDLMETGKEARK